MGCSARVRAAAPAGLHESSPRTFERYSGAQPLHMSRGKQAFDCGRHLEQLAILVARNEHWSDR